MFGPHFPVNSAGECLRSSSCLCGLRSGVLAWGAVAVRGLARNRQQIVRRNRRLVPPARGR